MNGGIFNFCKHSCREWGITEVSEFVLLAICLQSISMGHILKIKIPQQKVISDITIRLEFAENNFLLRYFDFKNMPNWNALKTGHNMQKFSNFGNPSLSTRAIAKIENTTIHLDESRWINKVQVVQTVTSPIMVLPLCLSISFLLLFSPSLSLALSLTVFNVCHALGGSSSAASTGPQDGQL